MISQQKIGENNYSYLYSGQGYQISLNVIKRDKISSSDFLYNGTMNIKNTNYNNSIKIYGKVEE